VMYDIPGMDGVETCTVDEQVITGDKEPELSYAER